MPLAALVAPVLGALGVSSTTAGLIGAGAGVVGSLIGGGGSGNPATTAANNAANLQLQMFNQTQQNLQPFMSTGSSAISQLASLFGFNGSGPNASTALSQLSQYPGYQFGLQQGVQALDRSAASRGMLLSGAQQKAVTEFGTNYAQQQAWQPYISELNTVSQLGENAAAGVGQQGTTAAANAGTALQNAGSASLNQQVGAQNTLTSALAQYQLANTGTGTGGSSYTYGSPGDAGTISANFAAGQDPSQLGLI